MIDSANIYEDFAYYINVCHENTAIQEYISWIRKDNKDKDLYKNFDFIYSSINKK